MTAEEPDLNRRYSVEEYLAFEEKAELRHEYWDGHIIPLGELVSMAGGVEHHSAIKTNFGGAIYMRLRGHRCRSYDSDLQVAIPGMGVYVYPDISIVCGDP